MNKIFETNIIFNNNTGKHPVISNKKTNSKTNFKGKKHDNFDNSSKNNFKKIVLTSIIGLGILTGIVYFCNSGKTIKSLFKKTNKTKKITEKMNEKTEQIREKISQIFGKEVSQNETNILIQKYKEIIDTDTSTNEGILKYIGNLYQQLMNDFGFKASKVELRLKPQDENIGACMSSLNDYIYIYCLGEDISRKIPFSKEFFMKALCHELTHARQNNLACATDKNKYVEVLIKRFMKKQEWQKFLSENNNDKNVAYNKIKQIFLNRIEKGLCSEVKPIPQSHPDYSKGLRYIGGMSNYKEYNKCLSEYKSQLIEEEAFRAGDLSQQLFDLIRNFS